jgi:hypothetical protein
MCLVAILSIAATAYLAVFFNRRAKADLTAALEPLAALIEGEMDLEEAEVIGRFDGQHVKARMANASEGPGRVWQAELLDAAGGIGWVYTSSLPKGESTEPRVEFASKDPELQHKLPALAPDEVTGVADPTHERFRLEYNPESGFLRFIVPMVNRRDIPDVEKLTKQLIYLVKLGDQNRAVQETLAVEVQP